MSTLRLSEGHTRALDYVANQELKGLSYVALGELGLGTRNDLAEATTAQTGLDTLGYVKTYPDTFEKHGFAEAIVDTGRNGRPSKFFATTDSETALPVIGATLGWSLDYPDFSLNDVLSTSSSKGSSAPTNSIQIFDGLLRGLPISDM